MNWRDRPTAKELLEDKRWEDDGAYNLYIAFLA